MADAAKRLERLLDAARVLQNGQTPQGAALRARLPALEWDELEAVWPEGSAGVALAALRLGRVVRAQAILDSLEPLRAAGGGMPTFTVEIPSEMDTAPSLAGTLWIELVRFELARDRDQPTLWRPG